MRSKPQEGPVSEVKAEVGFNLRNPLGGLWVRVALMVLDVFLDANTIITLIRAEQYECAFLLQACQGAKFEFTNRR